jgi:protein-S-isoprenylcysteine O-methyltransferase Ste14
MDTREYIMTIKIIVFLIIALLIFIKFKPALRSVNSHGFYVFFAFEFLLALLFFNIGFWMVKFLSLYQTLSWIFLASSAFIALSGFFCLKKYGKPEDEWENTTLLINKGIFRYIRHPLYLSLILLCIGILFKNATTIPLFLCSICILFLIIASLVEERENLTKFGDTYTDYMKSTRRYFPFVL